MPAEGSMKNTIEILLNGQSYSLERPFSLAELVAKLKVDPKYVAVAKNDEIVLRSALQETFVQNGDRIEMIRAVQGG